MNERFDIATVTMNPALDRTVFLKENLKAGKLNKVSSSILSAGGKGINVSRVLSALNVKNVALGFAGGVCGDILKKLLCEESIKTLFTETKAETRMNIKVISEKEELSEINEPGGPVYQEELVDIFSKIEKISEKTKIFLLCGSIPQGVDKSVYNLLTERLKSKGACVVADCSGETLKSVIHQQPILIKPNIDELSELVEKDLNTLDDVVENSVDIYKKYGTSVLCTMGGDGSVYAGMEGVYFSTAPKVEVKGFAGAGDSYLAVFLYKRLICQTDICEAMRAAAAAAAAVVEYPGTEIPDVKSFEKYIDEICVKKIG